MKRVSEKMMMCGAALVVCLFLDQHARSQNASRIRHSINNGWKFSPRDAAGSERLDFADMDWNSVAIPHTWNVADTLDDEPGYRRGVSWYRRELKLGPAERMKRIFIFFEGANQVTEVFVNGRVAGKHIGGYSAFSFDVTDLLRTDGKNVVAVKVDNSLDKDIPPLDADFNMYGGIYRDVWIVVTDPVHIKVTDHASPGVVIRTPEVSREAATVEISGTIVNSTGRTREVEVLNTITDPNGKTTTLVSKVRIAPNAEAEFKQTSKPILRPRLWSPGDPNLYKVRTTVRERRRTIDEVSNPLGFRWFTIDADRGFFLNGKHLKLRGTNRHQDREGLGNAVPDRLHVRDLEIIKEDGFNFVRLAHYPQDPSVLEAADRLGLIVWEETPIVNLIHLSAAFSANSRNMLREMIRQHRNHPSVVMWGYMNEIFLRAPKDDETVRATVQLARELEAISRTEDPTRLTTIAFDRGADGIYHKSGLSDVTQIVGWNLYHGWYYETFEDFGRFLDDQHRRFPGRPMIVSEYGANADRRVHSLVPQRFDSSIEWQQMYHESYLSQIESRPFIAGSAIWNQFDFGSEFRGETIPHINQKGMYTFARKPKDISFFYRATYSNEAVVHIAAGDWRVRSGPRSQTIVVYSNLDRIGLFLNGSSLGNVQIGPDRKGSMSVRFADGENRLKAVGRSVAGSFSHEVRIDYRDPSSTAIIAINCGSNTEVVDSQGTIWQADLPGESRPWSYTGNANAKVDTRQNILGTLDDPIYQTMREGPSAYEFEVPDGLYEIEMRFAEPKFKQTGTRVFDVSVNGRRVLAKLDAFAEAGFMKHLSRKFMVSTNGGQAITIELIPVKNLPIISGIRLKRVN